MTSPQVICILGMHRSGTSCLTGSLQNAGLQLGKHHTWNKYNTRGNRENQDFVDFHEQLLAKNEAAWDHPPVQLRYDSDDIAAARELVAGFGSKRWGFKDPRAMLALPLWREVLPEAAFVGIFRHPLAVQDSLQRRDHRMTDEHCLALWYHYNRLLLRAHRQQPFPLLCFDWDEETFHRKLNSVLEGLELRALEPDERFYSNELRHSPDERAKTLPWKLRWLYWRLSRRTV